MLIWKNVDNQSNNVINSWMSQSDKHFLCMENKTWKETAEDISDCLNFMPKSQFKNIIGEINNKPALAIMLGVEDFGATLNIYNILVNPEFRNKGIITKILSDLNKNKNIFDLKQTYNQIKMSVLPENKIMQSVLKKSKFTDFIIDDEYLVFTKQINKNNQIEF